MKSKICPICNKEFFNNDKYCSIDCQHVSMRVFNYDINNPPKCLNCNEILSHRKANSNAKYCSMLCKNQYLEKYRQAKIVCASNQLCEICGKQLTDNQILNKRRVCSAKCAYKLRVSLYGEVSDANADKFVQYATTNNLRNDLEYRKRCGEFFKCLWKQDEFRNKKISYMKTNNPIHKDGVVNKVMQTKEEHGILHTWLGTRGGNGAISECEQLIYDFCIQHGFEYNKAISTYTLRKQYPDRHYGFNYKPDFTNSKYKICVEIDGKGHHCMQNKERDIKKEFCLTTLGYVVLRFTNDEVKNDISAVKDVIMNKLKEKGYQHGEA